MSNKDLQDQALLMSELLIKVTALEKALIAKGLINEVDITTETAKIVTKLTELVKQNMEEANATRNAVI